MNKESFEAKKIAAIGQHVNGRGPEAVISFTDGSSVSWVHGQPISEQIGRVEFGDESGMNVVPSTVSQVSKEVTQPHELDKPVTMETILITLLHANRTDVAAINPGFMLSLVPGMTLYFRK